MVGAVSGARKSSQAQIDIASAAATITNNTVRFADDPVGAVSSSASTDSSTGARSRGGRCVCGGVSTALGAFGA